MKMLENLQQNGSKQTELFQTSSLEGSHAKTYRLQETKKALAKAQGRASGQSAPVLLGRFDPITQSLKTSQHSLLENQGNGLSEFYGTYPRSGMMRSGTVYQLPNLARTITEIGSGLLPTPRVLEVIEHPMKQAARLGDRTGKRPNNLQSMAKFDLFPKQYLPTPVSSDATTGQIIGKNDTFKMTKKGNMSNPCLQRRIEKGKQLMLSQVVHPTSGKLNPNWVEWLMGYPTGHTDLKDSETP